MSEAKNSVPFHIEMEMLKNVYNALIYLPPAGRKRVVRHAIEMCRDQDKRNVSEADENVA